MAEKTPTQQLAEKLLYTPAYAADKSADVKKAAADFAEGYRKFLDNGKTEREVAAESEQMLKDAGYQLFAFARAIASCSPMPPVKTMASTPPIAAM